MGKHRKRSYHLTQAPLTDYEIEDQRSFFSSLKTGQSYEQVGQIGCNFLGSLKAILNRIIKTYSTGLCIISKNLKLEGHLYIMSPDTHSKCISELHVGYDLL